jgi:hypothetical protein
MNLVKIQNQAKKRQSGYKFPEREYPNLPRRDRAIIPRLRIGILLFAIGSFAFTCSPREILLGEVLNNLDRGKILSINHKRIKDSWEILGDQTQLEELQITYSGIESIPESWGKLQNLRQINLYGNKIQDLPKSFSELKNLEVLVLGKNPIQEVPSALSGLPKLKIVSLDETKLSLTEADVLVLSSIPSLEILDLSETKDIQSVPSNIGLLSGLKEIHWKKTGLDQSDREKIYEALPKVKHLK